MPLVAILLGAAILCAANLAATLRRTTIPLAFDGPVAAKAVLREKHPGVDDVCLLILEGRDPIQVDRALYDAVEEGDHLRKLAWSRVVDVDGDTLALPWSADFLGMLAVMPVVMVAALVLVLLAPKPAGTRGEPRDLGLDW